MLSHYNGYYWMEWYNGVDSEGVKNRVLYASSRDAVTWSRPAVMFNATAPGKITRGFCVLSVSLTPESITIAVGVENEPQVLIGGRRLYSVAGSWDVNKRTGLGAEHTGPDTPMMRRVLSPTSLGPVFWLGRQVPQGYEEFGYPTYLEMDAQTKADALEYLAASLAMEPQVDWGMPNGKAERCVSTSGSWDFHVSMGLSGVVVQSGRCTSCRATRAA